jgi:hypothetical protein
VPFFILNCSLKWYKGTIVNIEQGGYIDVAYSDGEMDYYLSLRNIKLFKPYTKGEIIEVNPSGGDFIRARILDKLNDDKLYVRLQNDKSQIVIGEEAVRRFY